MRALAVTVAEASDMIGISESLIWQLLRAGDLARVKIGRRTLIRVAELERYLAASETSANGIVASVHHFTSERSASG